jgi:L-threonylcarbamoyladenylate synthase
VNKYMARIIHTSYTRPDQRIIEEAYRVIRDCGLVVGVTDTLYGIFTTPYIDECVEKVYNVKRRRDKPIPVLVSSIEALEKIAGISDRILYFLKIIWPGPVTVIMRDIVEDVFSEKIHLGTNKIGFRIPASPLARRLAEYNGGFITGTSANISGYKPARSIDEAYRQLRDNIDLYIDSGTAPIGVSSTVIEIVGDKLRIIREGALPLSVLEKLYSLTSKQL